LGSDLSTLDLAVGEMSSEGAAQVEDLANQVIFENRPVIIREVDESELSSLGLRRPAKKRGRIRVVDITGFDRSACGGTHVRHTGEVGCIKLRRWERAKGGVRVEFLCGWRALRDYRDKSSVIWAMAAKFSVKDSEVGDAVERLSAQVRERDRALAEQQDRLIELEAQRRLAGLRGSPRIIAEIMEDWTAQMASQLAGRLAGDASTIAVLGTPGGRVVIARSADLDLDAAAMLRRVVEPLGGRGGGRPAFAQGAVPAPRLADAVHAIRAELVATLRPSVS
jgi:alanyl-tRNA synthetase